jgi:hypothetical protein
MKVINRAVAVIRPRQPFLEWCRAAANLPELSLGDLAVDASVFLLPGYDDEDEAGVLVDQYWQTILEHELAAWEQDQRRWPSGRSLTMFLAWFEVDLHGLVIDLGEGSVEVEQI